MRIISFNVNGIRSMVGKIKNGEKKGTKEENVIRSLIEEQQPDVLCFQEIKTQSKQDVQSCTSSLPFCYTNVATNKKGYSGVALLCKEKPEWVKNDLGYYKETEWGKWYEGYEFMKEGRMITAKFSKVIVVTVYVPNSQPELARLAERLTWEEMVRTYLDRLKEEFELPIVLCGDLNVAHQEMDIYDPRGKSKIPGFSKEEREECGKLLEGFTDTFRHLYPETRKYTYWSNFAQSRIRDVGWRIDYIVVSKAYQDRIVEADCLKEYGGSDHCPVLATIQL